MGKRIWIGLLLASWLGAAWAGGPSAVRKQVESSLLVTGTIDIQADGSVVGHALDKPETIADAIAGIIARAVPLWRFEPIELDPGVTRARATMSIRLVARKIEDGNLSVEISAVRFIGRPRPGEVPVGVKRQHPAYPKLAMRHGVGGTVYTVMKVGRDGRVEDAVAEQVNLRIVTSEKDMEGWRDLLAEAALRAARQWTFSPPTEGDEAGKPYWLVRVPMEFVAWKQKSTEEGQWHAYVPGPPRETPWKWSDRSGEGADAFAAGGEYPVGSGPRLLGARATP